MLLRSQATFPDVSEAGSSQTSPIPELGSAGPSQRTVGRSKAPAKRRTREKRFLKVSPRRVLKCFTSYIRIRVLHPTI